MLLKVLLNHSMVLSPSNHLEFDENMNMKNWTNLMVEKDFDEMINMIEKNSIEAMQMPMMFEKEEKAFLGRLALVDTVVDIAVAAVD